jgi:hypothetical protein
VGADQTNLTTKSATGPLKLRQQAARLAVRRNIFSIRVVEEWNKIPHTMKNYQLSDQFQEQIQKTRLRTWWYPHLNYNWSWRRKTPV